MNHCKSTQALSQSWQLYAGVGHQVSTCAWWINAGRKMASGSPRQYIPAPLLSEERSMVKKHPIQLVLVMCWNGTLAEMFLKNRERQEQSLISLLNHRIMACVGRDIRAHPVPMPLPQAGTPCPRPGCSDHHPTRPWTLPGVGHPQILWTTCSVPHCSHSKELLPHILSTPTLF